MATGTHPLSHAQLYIYEPQAALDVHMQQNVGLNCSEIMRALQAMLSEHHQYVPLYCHTFEILWNYDPANDVEVRLRLTPGLNHRRYNLPMADEVAVVLLGNHSTEPHDIVFQLCSGPLHRISSVWKLG